LDDFWVAGIVSTAGKSDNSGLAAFDPQSPLIARDMIDEQFTAEELILRDHLALDRTRLANERTLLAYLRTALMLVVAGATAEKVMGDSPTIVATGWAFIVFGGAVAAFGTWRFLSMQREINRRRMPPDRY
jgi:putative membrane protein